MTNNNDPDGAMLALTEAEIRHTAWQLVVHYGTGEEAEDALHEHMGRFAYLPEDEYFALFEAIHLEIRELRGQIEDSDG